MQPQPLTCCRAQDLLFATADHSIEACSCAAVEIAVLITFFSTQGVISVVNDIAEQHTFAEKFPEHADLFFVVCHVPCCPLCACTAAASLASLLLRSPSIADLQRSLFDSLLASQSCAVWKRPFTKRFRYTHQLRSDGLHYTIICLTLRRSAIIVSYIAIQLCKQEKWPYTLIYETEPSCSIRPCIITSIMNSMPECM